MVEQGGILDGMRKGIPREEASHDLYAATDKASDVLGLHSVSFTLQLCVEPIWRQDAPSGDLGRQMMDTRNYGCPTDSSTKIKRQRGGFPRQRWSRGPADAICGCHYPKRIASARSGAARRLATNELTNAASGRTIDKTTETAPSLPRSRSRCLSTRPAFSLAHQDAQEALPPDVVIIPFSAVIGNEGMYSLCGREAQVRAAIAGLRALQRPQARVRLSAVAAERLGRG